MSAELRALAEAAGLAGFCRTLHVGSDGRRQEVCITGDGILALLDERDAAIRRASLDVETLIVAAWNVSPKHYEGTGGGPGWPGPCAGCCEPGDDCICGAELAAAGFHRSIYPTQFTRPDYVMPADNDGAGTDQE